MSDAEDKVENVSETTGKNSTAENKEISSSTIANILVVPNESVRDLEAVGADTENESDDYEDDSDESYDSDSLSGSYTDYSTSGVSDEELEAPEGAVSKLAYLHGAKGLRAILKTIKPLTEYESQT